MNEVITKVDSAFIFITAISVLFLLGITVAMVYFMIRYREKKNPQSSEITGNTTLEVLWTVIPLILVLGMFFYGWDGFRTMRDVPPDAYVVKVTGRMWSWSFEYSTGKKSDTIMYVPVGKPIKAELTSNDVNHSFYLHDFRVKEDVVPGVKNYLWFEATKEGTYDIFCAEYCGMNHSYMLGKLVIMPQDKFNEWVNKVDTVKKIDSVQTQQNTTTQTPTDTSKTKSGSKDSIKTQSKDSLLRKEKK